MIESALTESERNAKGIAAWWITTLTGFRKKYNLSVEGLARLLPAKADLVADWESGKERPPFLVKRALRNLDDELTVKAMRSTDRAAPFYRSGPGLSAKTGDSYQALRRKFTHRPMPELYQRATGRGDDGQCPVADCCL